MMMRRILVPLFAGFMLQAGAETRGPPTGWSQQVRAGSVHHFDADLDGGGQVGLHRYYGEGGLAYLFRQDRLISWSVGYGRDDYRFDLPAGSPWEDIQNVRSGLFVRWGRDDAWDLFGAASVRAYAEEGASFSDAITGALFGGASYRFNDRLKLGPGLGVVGQLEEDPRVFPIIVVDWDLTDRLNLTTGGGLAASGGPGLTLRYKVDKNWQVALTGRYEQRRFRLSDGAVVPGGIGEDRNIPVIGSVSYVLYPGTQLSFLLGMNMDGRLSADTPQGRTLYRADYDSGLFTGLTLGLRL